jgi:glycolate oxidase FAD binding subunit
VSTAAAPIADPLRRVVGDALATGSATAPFAVAGVPPSAVAFPESTEQVAQLVALARENGWIVEPAGAGTWLHAGRPPRRVDLAISTRRISGVVEYEPADLTIGVGAGMSLGELQRVTAANRQVLPLDPPGSAEATAGATFATASAGPLRLGHGLPRDHALGLEVVTGAGTVLNVGGRVVKNVAGYDLVRMFVGSRGALGIITRLHLRLRPAPERDVTTLLVADDEGPLLAAAPEVLSRARPAALELLAPPLAARLAGAPRWMLAVRVQGNRGTVEQGTERVAHARERASGASQAHAVELVAPPADAAAALWTALVAAEGDARVMARLSDVPARLGSTLTRALAIARTGGSWSIAAHAGTGIVRAWSADAIAPSAAARTKELITEARQALAERGGSVLVLSGMAPLGDDFDPFAESAGTLALMRALRSRFDPDAVLSPGRFVS